MAVLLITHDLAVVAQMASRVIVMYAGVVVEESPVRSLFEATAHPYTEGLLASIAKLARRGDRLSTIPGNVPDPFRLPPGCRFSDRCPKRFEKCPTAEPPLFDVSPDHRSRCWLCGG